MVPTFELWPLRLKAFRPWTKTALSIVSSLNYRGATGINLHIRHKAGSDCLEGKAQPREETRQVATKARAHGQQAREEGESGEEEADDDEGEHEPRRQEVVVGSVKH